MCRVLMLELWWGAGPSGAQSSQQRESSLLRPAAVRSLQLGGLQPERLVSSTALALGAANLDSRLSNIFADVPLAASPADRGQIEAELRRRALEREIEAQLEANRRMAEGFDTPTATPAIADTPFGATARPEVAPQMEQLPVGSAEWLEALARPGEEGRKASYYETELEKERALTAAMEHAAEAWLPGTPSVGVM
jgi:hypothetical protein